MSSSSASPSKEKFCSIIGEIVDKTCDIIVDTEEALDYDAVELTVLLKSIGFRLNSFEFDINPEPDSNDVELEIRCKRSGITSKLQLNAKKCTCPERNKKTETDNSYWEIQGRGPQTPVSRFKGIVKDTSCDLLPDISRKSTNIARTTLAMLLQNYRNDISPDKNKDKNIDVKTFAEYLNIKMPNTVDISSASRTTSMPSILENDTQIHKFQSADDLSSTNFNGNSIPTTNGTNSGCENEKTDESLAFQNPSSLKSEINSLNELNFQFDYEPTEKDRNLVQKILKARKDLDVALKLIKEKPSSINMGQLSDLSFTEITTKPPIGKTTRSIVKTRKSLPSTYHARKPSFGSSNDNPSRFSLPMPKTPPKPKLIKRDSFNASDNKGTLKSRPAPLQRTGSGTYLRPNTNNLTKGQVTKTNVTKLNSNSMKK